MRMIHDTSIAIPSQVDSLVQAASAHPAVRSVILYGSRAVGSHREDSDWDLCVDVVPDLVGRFTAVRDSCIERLLRDSVHS